MQLYALYIVQNRTEQFMSSIMSIEAAVFEISESNNFYNFLFVCCCFLFRCPSDHFFKYLHFFVTNFYFLTSVNWIEKNTIELIQFCYCDCEPIEPKFQEIQIVFNASIRKWKKYDVKWKEYSKSHQFPFTYEFRNQFNLIRLWLLPTWLCQ